MFGMAQAQPHRQFHGGPKNKANGGAEVHKVGVEGEVRVRVRRMGLRPRPACCPDPATRPHYSTEKLSPLCATGNMERLGGKRRESPPKFLCARVPTGKGEKGKREKVRMSLSLPCTPYYALADRTGR